eukprot:TRINITY_DN1907_c0_g1_i1.p1 TRINITY_DN1907_c0_g1~~TRINITY_DN1907_c0_g1_i1.p1  ORF type:complete len:175 (-),score=30.52 TRINITY_DN1907_c0_g1_i1:479-1003(-)
MSFINEFSSHQGKTSFLYYYLYHRQYYLEIKMSEYKSGKHKVQNTIIFNTKFNDLNEIENNSLQWFSEPTKQVICNENGLVVKVDRKTDYWNQTHYNFSPHNGHFLYCELEDDYEESWNSNTSYEIQTRIKFYPHQLFDQSGLLIKRNEGSWVKCSVEFGNQEESSKLGSVGLI